jgi:hypothetical protein
MNTTRPHRSVSSLLALLALAVLSLSVVPEASAARERTRSAKGDRGGSGEARTTRDRGNVERDATWTNPAGGTGQHSFNRTWDPSTGTGTVAASTTRASGATSNREGTLSKTAPGSGTSAGTFTRANGATGTYQGATTKTDTGRETTRSATTSDGKTASSAITTAKTDSGAGRTAVRTGPNGGTATAQTDVTKTDTGYAAERTVTKTPPPAK